MRQKRLSGESRYLPNLKFELGAVQLCEVTVALEKLEGAHHTRMNWMGPYSLEQSDLSIHAQVVPSIRHVYLRKAQRFGLRKF